MKAVEVSIEGRVVGLFASPEQGPWFAMVGNIPRKYMRAHIMTQTPTEAWQWQLPDVQEGERIEFRIVEATPNDIRPAQFVRKLDTQMQSDGKDT
jgi:hypothetical protein